MPIRRKTGGRRDLTVDYSKMAEQREQECKGRGPHVTSSGETSSAGTSADKKQQQGGHSGRGFVGEEENEDRPAGKAGDES